MQTHEYQRGADQLKNSPIGTVMNIVLIRIIALGLVLFKRTVCRRVRETQFRHHSVR